MEELATSQLATLGHPQRLRVFRLLMRRYPDEVSAGEIADATDIKLSTLSAYLSSLTQAGLIGQNRKGRSVLYRALMPQIRALMDYLVMDCCRGRPENCFVQPDKGKNRMDAKQNVLFICVGNSARSIFAEAILRDMAGDRFNAYSAGTQPYSELNPEAVAVLERKGHDVSDLRAKHISEFQRKDAPIMDYVFTVCDRAANEECPAWPGQPVSGHFSTQDPVGQDALAFQQAYGSLWNRITLFVERTKADMSRAERQQTVDDIAAGAGLST